MRSFVIEPEHNKAKIKKQKWDRKSARILPAVREHPARTSLFESRVAGKDAAGPHAECVRS
jgi:hypothetical protein